MMTPTKQQTRPFSKQLNVDKISQQQNIPSTNIVVNSWQSATLEVVKKTVFTQTDAVGPCQPKTQAAAQNSEESTYYICEICDQGFASSEQLNIHIQDLHNHSSLPAQNAQLPDEIPL